MRPSREAHARVWAETLMSTRALLSLACTALAVVALGAPAAHASIIGLSSGVYTYTATSLGGTNDNTITIVSSPDVSPSIGTFTFTDTSTISSAPASCTEVSDNRVICPALGISAILVNAGVGNDTVSMSRISAGPSVPLELNGEAGADGLTGFLDGDEIDGGPGDDTLNGGAGEDTITGGDDNDEVNGGDGSDTRVAGGEGNDTLTGGDGEDAILGEGGDDVVLGGTESDSVNGGPGVDRIRYDEANRLAGVTVDLSTTAGTDGSPGESEDAVQFERVTGTRFVDTITGDAQANQLDGGLAADRLSGAAGNDTLNGGDGDDQLTGGVGVDALRGQGGLDVLDGGPDADLLDGGPDVDVVDYSARGEDLTVTIGAGGDDDGGSQDGAPGARDEVAASEVLLGGSGRDTFTMAESASVTLHGNGGDDVLTGGALDDLLVGGPGADTLDGRGGKDTASYNDAARTVGVTVSIGAGAGNDGSSFDAGAGGAFDTVLAIETVQGSAFADTLIGDGSPNDLLGGGGDDVLQGGGGSDVLQGNDGSDTVSYADRTTGQPVTVVLGGTANNGAPLENDVVGNDVENVTGGDGADTITGDDAPNALLGLGGADLIAGLGGADLFVAGEGDDLVRAVDGLADTVDCDGGTDTVDPDAADSLVGCELLLFPPPVRRDSDGDTFADDQDCAPLDARIFPGAVEIAGNQVDENCDGVRADFPILNTLVTVFANFDRTRGARINGLIVRNIPAGAQVTISCKPPRGKRCPFTRTIRRTFPQGRSRIDFKTSFKRKRLPIGTVIEIRVTKPDAIGKVRIETIRPRGFRSQTRCVRPGATKTIRCPT